jgi:hypothetical protein
VLKIGVWARLQMEQGGPLGDELLRRFVAYERRWEGRRGRLGFRMARHGLVEEQSADRSGGLVSCR